MFPSMMKNTLPFQQSTKIKPFDLSRSSIWFTEKWEKPEFNDKETLINSYSGFGKLSFVGKNKRHHQTWQSGRSKEIIKYSIILRQSLG